MSDYITNSKNRKLKTKILLFLSRINVGAGKLPISGRVILLMNGGLILSLFFPWIELVNLENVTKHFGAFSAFSLYIGYMLMASIIITPFFLLSHSKKEQIRAFVPFRLSDTQAIVFLTSITIVGLVHLIILTGLYSDQIAALGANLGSGFKIAFSSTVCIIISAFFLSQSTKISNTEIYYLDHNTSNELGEYKDILHPGNEKNEKNMSLPI